MKATLLPADNYIVVNKTILTEKDKEILINLYEPIIGALSISLYLTLQSDLDNSELISGDYNHHHLMTRMKASLSSIKTCREALESFGLIKTYVKPGDINYYVYELYSPLSAYEFFNNPIFNVVLYNNIGKNEYEVLKKKYGKIKVNLKEYEDISAKMNETFSSSNYIEPFDVNKKNTNNIVIDDQIDFDLLMSSLPKGLINERIFNKKTKDLINNLAFIYNLDTVQMSELVRSSINQNGAIEKEELRKLARKYYQFCNNGTLPTIIYRTQPEYLKNPSGDNSKRGKIIGVFENTTPYDFLKNKYKGVNPTSRDLKLLEMLLIDIELKPAVVNVLIDYILKENNNKLTTGLVETIAGQWKRAGVETASDAMSLAEKEHKKFNKNINKNSYKEKETIKPVWFNEKIEKEDITEEEQQELADLLKEFR